MSGVGSIGDFSDDPANAPLTKVADELTARDNTLFVVGAGKEGPAPKTNGSDAGQHDGGTGNPEVPLLATAAGRSSTSRSMS